MDDLSGSHEGPESASGRCSSAYRAVGRRERTVAELRTFLERKRVEPEAIDDAVAELTEAGLLDDARYAQRFAEDKRELERWGSERIARELQRRGVAARPDRGRRGRPQPRGRAARRRCWCSSSARRRRATTASATAPGACWSAAATRPSWPTRRCAATSGPADERDAA